MHGLVPDNRRAQVMSETGTTRIALVGCGFIAEVHMQVLARMPGVKVTALCDPARTRLEGMGRRYGITQLFDSVEDMVAAQVADAVHVLVKVGGESNDGKANPA